MQFSDSDPILAIATPAGSGGIGIVRLSFASRLNDLVIETLFEGRLKPTPRHAHLCTFFDEKGQKIDDLIVLFFKGPHSYTGESVIELQAHGGPVLMQMLQRAVLKKCEALGFRLAAPGEFTKRAYLNGRLDLAQAEAVADVISAMSEGAVQAAQRSLSGEFSQRVREIDEALKDVRAYVEATLDFPEEEVDHLNRGAIFVRLEGIKQSLLEIFSKAHTGSVLREGITVRIVGSPNVGKSSLLNALAGEEVAIVTDIAGTTRDKIEHWVTIRGVPLRVVDTAGIRETNDVVELKGIERAFAEVAKAQVVLHLVDASGEIADDQATLERLLEKVSPGTPLLTIANKVDLVPQKAFADNVIKVSAKSTAGLADLQAKLLSLVGIRSGTDGVFMARQRHLRALEKALEHVDLALAFGREVSQIDLFAEELRLAGEPLQDILGEFVVR